MTEKHFVHFSSACACGINGAGQVFVDPICAKNNEFRAGSTIGTQLAIDAFFRLERAKRRVENLEQELQVFLSRNDVDLPEYAQCTDLSDPSVRKLRYG